MDKKYVEDARSTFMTEGWTTFQSELDEAIAGCTLEGCNSTEEFWQMKGRIITLRQIAGYENLILAAEDQQDEDDA